ncbi:hypothetical protein BC938DRAFT_470505 [Jimgerdemannia flammicorona]|uniref:Uncharacterized protein n=1 Tax=Jimgerdemannia flammicorona TaxID=994334 RepID=A0A433QA22_9FUNG|nr:hypothetical protein BC938DRAFT_470505 [Jimgerdemannia flammicorona]
MHQLFSTSPPPTVKRKQTSLRGVTRQEGHINWMLSSPDPTPIAFFRYISPTHRVSTIDKYWNALNLALKQTDDQGLQDKLKRMKETTDEARILRDWEMWMQEKAAIGVRRSVRETNLYLHDEINTLARNKGDEEENDEDNEVLDSSVNNADPKRSDDKGSDEHSSKDGEEQTAFVVNIFQETITASSADVEIADIFRSFTGAESIMDLRPSSKFPLAIDTNCTKKFCIKSSILLMSSSPMSCISF